MALRMVGLGRAKDGRWFARKGIPEDVCDEYKRLYGVRHEEHLKLPADTPRPEAKVRLAEWVTDVETRIATLRAKNSGEGQPLTKLNAIALAGCWYNWFVKQHEDDPGPAKRWREMGDYFVWNVLREHAPAEYEARPGDDPSWEWANEPEVREAIRPHVAELARVAAFLASEGVALNNDAYVRFVDAVAGNLYPAIALLERRASGDYSPDTTPESFPPFTNSASCAGGPVGRDRGLDCWTLFEDFVKATRPADSTVQRWRSVFLEMQRAFADVGANGITEDAARAWVRGLVTTERAPRTVSEVWLTASRRVFAWGLEHKHVRVNPFVAVKVDVPKKVSTRETGKAFTPEEARTILQASLAYKDPRTPLERAKRWVPWLCAYSGARAGEITQLRGSDIEQRSGGCGSFHVMRLTPDAGPIKSRQARVVPLHEHIVVQGFLEMVSQVGKGALFYDDKAPHRPGASSDPLNPRRSQAGNVRTDIGKWVRKIGVTHEELSPTHAWRHTFKQTAERVGISEKINDAITGHTPASEARKYGPPTPADMAEALQKFPRYKLDVSSSPREDSRVVSTTTGEHMAYTRHKSNQGQPA
jgi:integrase